MSTDKPGGDELQDARRPLIFIHSSIDDLTDLTPNAMRVYMHLARRAGKANSAFPSYQSIGDHCFSSVSANQATRKSFARKAIEQLIEAGLVSKTNRNTDGVNQSNVYKLVEPTHDGAGGVPIKHTMPIDTPMPIKHTPVPIKHGVCLIGTKGNPSEGDPIEGTPQKGARVATKPAQPKPPPAPAVAIWRELTGLTPNKSQIELIVQTVTDCDLWRKRLTEWLAGDHKPGNVREQLVVYANGWQTKRSHNGRAPAQAAEAPAFRPLATFIVQEQS